MAFRSSPFGNRPQAFQGPLMQELRQANELMAAGRPHDAAQIVAQIAQQVQARGQPRRAAALHALAAHGFAESRDEQAALDQARTALSQALQLGMMQRASVFYGNIERRLRAQGLNGAADTLQKEFGATIKPLASQESSTASHPPLPAKCPNCGAPLLSDQVEWLDANTAECPYCGAPVQGVG